MISIITACFNSEATVAKTIESVINQELVNYEFIIVDGDSKDNTVDIIKRYVPLFEKKNIIFKWISEPDKGIYDAWNKGVEMASCQWISFVGADDLLQPEYTKIYSEFLEQKDDLDFVSSNVHIVKEGAVIKKIDEGWNWKRFKTFMNVGHVGALHHKRLYDAYGKYDESIKIVGDYEFLLRVGDKLKAGYVDKLTVLMGADGVSNANTIQALKETRLVKLKTQTCGIIEANADYYIALIKAFLRRVKYTFF
ncbi:MAG: glycosyltransferase [Bacteroidales bacterium]|nr:glycosyltransferase [Bacteroidales bacterium]